MKHCIQTILSSLLTLALFISNAPAQTDGSARLEVTILDYTGTSSPNHYAVVWVTTQAGGFIKTLRKQGPSSWTSSEWANHCGTWNSARAGSTALDGYSTATAHNYSTETFTGVGLVTNSPIFLNWNCRDASNNLMPDGSYKFWVQYAENSSQGPYTTSGLTWTKGTTAATNSYPNQGVNFASMRVAWNPVVVPTVPPEFTKVELIGGNLVMSGTGPTNGACAVLISSQPDLPVNQWSAISTNACDANGQFRITNSVSVGISSRFYRLKVQ